jgi:hypothetical protein
MQAQLDSLEAALNLAVLSHYAELSERLTPASLAATAAALSLKQADDLATTRHGGS